MKRNSSQPQRKVLLNVYTNDSQLPHNQCTPTKKVHEIGL